MSSAKKTGWRDDSVTAQRLEGSPQGDASRSPPWSSEGRARNELKLELERFRFSVRRDFVNPEIWHPERLRDLGRVSKNSLFFKNRSQQT